jgi:hypothetical protein
MLLRWWLDEFQFRLLNPVRRLHARQVRRSGLRLRRQPFQSVTIAAEVQPLEQRVLLSSVLADTTPIATVNAAEGTSTGDVVLATFTDSNPTGGPYTTLDAPDATETTSAGVSGSLVAGTYSDADYNLHGFVFDSSTATYKTFDTPGTTQPTVVGISGSYVVGNYFDYDNYVQHGFVYDASMAGFTTVDPPDSVSTTVVAASSSTVAGTCAPYIILSHLRRVNTGAIRLLVT